MRWLVVGLIMVFALAACETRHENGTEDDRDELAPVVPSEPPAVRSDTILIEGIPEPIELRLFRPEEPFALPFWTYLPERWQAEQYTEEKTVVFAPVGRLAEDAFLSVRIYPAGMTRDDAWQRLRTRAVSDALATAQEVVALDDAPPRWALAAVVYAAGPIAGRASLGAHGNRFFEVLERYPVELGDGFAPIASLILDEWRWAPDGAPLVADREDGEASLTPPQ